MQSNCPPAALSRTGAVLVWVIGAVAGALRICEQPGAAAQAQLAFFPGSSTCLLGGVAVQLIEHAVQIKQVRR
jgi:hypothetical protein